MYYNETENHLKPTVASHRSAGARTIAGARSFARTRTSGGFRSPCPFCRPGHVHSRSSRIFKFAGLAAAALALLLACEHPVGIFASLEQEIPVDEERGVPTTDGMRFMVRASSGGGDDYYYAAFTSLYVREADEGTGSSPDRSWSRVSRPSGVNTSDPVTSIVAFDDRIWAIFDGDVYSRPADGGSDDDWDKENIDDVPGSRTASRLFTVTDGADDRLLLSVRDDDSEYSVYYLNGGNFDEMNIDAPDGLTQVRAVAYFDPGGDNFYLATSGALYRSDGIGGTYSAISQGDLGAGGPYRELLVAEVNGDDTLFVAARRRVLSYDGTTWSDSGTFETSGGSDIVFTSLGWVNDTDLIGTSGGYLIAGTQNAGLFEAPGGAVTDLRREGSGSTLFGRVGNYLTTRLSGGAIDRIFVVEEGRSWRNQGGNHIYVGAPGRGLWRGESDRKDDVILWRRE